MSTLTISMPSGGSGRLHHPHRRFGDVEDPVLAFDEEMVVIGGVGVEIGL